MFNLFKPFDIFKIGYSGSTYNPLINYDWSTTTTSGLRYLKDVGSTPTYNASMYFGRGAYFNGIDQQISIEAPTTGTILTRYSDFSYMLNIGSEHTGSRGKLFMPYFNNVAIERNNFGDLLLLFDDSAGRKTIDIVSSTTSGVQKHLTVTKSGDFIYLYVNSILTQTISTSTLVVGMNSTYIGGVSNYSQYSKGTIKDVYIFGRALTQDEITQSYEQPELFYAMAQADSTCVLNMPMCETSSTARNYKTGIDYAIINYTTSVRDNAKNLQYGLQTCKFVRDSLGVIQSASNYLECDGVGYGDTGWIPNANEDWSIEQIRGKDTFQVFDGIWSATGAQRLAIGTEINGNIRIDVGSINKYISPGVYSNIKTYIVVSYKYLSKTVLIYENGIEKHNFVTNLATSTTTFPLGRRSDALVLSNAVKRLFKVHNKVLTQEEVTKNYNSYVAKGLLS